jgi:hypothetical protein
MTFNEACEILNLSDNISYKSLHSRYFALSRELNERISATQDQQLLKIYHARLAKIEQAYERVLRTLEGNQPGSIKTPVSEETQEGSKTQKPAKEKVLHFFSSKRELWVILVIVVLGLVLLNWILTHRGGDKPPPNVPSPPDSTEVSPDSFYGIIPEGYELRKPEYEEALTSEGIFSKQQKKMKYRILDGKTFEQWDMGRNPYPLWKAVKSKDNLYLLHLYFKPVESMPLTEDEPAQDPSPNEEDNEGVKPPKEAGGGKPVDEKKPPPPKPTTDCVALERKLFTLQAELNVENDLTLKRKIEQKIVAVEELCIEKRCNCN